MTEERAALILYGSETGNAQDIAEELERLCERLRFTTAICELNSVKISQLVRSSLVLIAISTTGQGDLPANSQIFWRSIRSVRLPPNCLSSVQFASFGLGDSSYPKFNWAHRKLHNRFVQLGARPLCDRGESDDQHPEGIDGLFVPWSLTLRNRLLEEFPLPEGTDPVPDDVIIEPKWILQFADNAANHTIANGNAEEPSPDPVPIPDSLIATIKSNNRVTPTSHFQDTRLLSLDIQGHHQYTPGATLTIYPKNFPKDVNEFITLMHWQEISDNPLEFTPTRPLTIHDQPPISVPRGYPLTIRTLLTNHLDIMSIPRRSFFAHLLHYTTDPMHIERLQEFISPDLIDELYDYTTRPRRSILEVLTDFTSTRLPWSKICSIIPHIRGRQFSIASGGELKLSPETNSTRVDLLIAIVKYRTIMKRIRDGVATRYIATLKPGQEISATLQQGGLGNSGLDIRKPVVMISPGTGVAPMRSLLWERKLQRERLELESTGHRDLLFFGCRMKDVDDYFSDEWRRDDLNVDVYNAYSRDQKQKVYVQDLIKEQGPAVFEALAARGGLVFVCGSSGRMPQAVRNALTEVFQTQGGMAMTDAEAYLAKMEKEGRYKQETW